MCIIMYIAVVWEINNPHESSTHWSRTEFSSVLIKLMYLFWSCDYITYEVFHHDEYVQQIMLDSAQCLIVKMTRITRLVLLQLSFFFNWMYFAIITLFWVKKKSTTNITYWLITQTTDQSSKSIIIFLQIIICSH